MNATEGSSVPQQEPITPKLIAEAWAPYYDDLTAVHLHLGRAGVLARGYLELEQRCQMLESMLPNPQEDDEGSRVELPGDAGPR